MTASDAYDRLVAAGAPPLPEGRFYRIRETLEGLLVVEIRERRPRGRSRRVASAEVYQGRESLLEAVAAAARHAAERIAYREDVADLEGDHYP